MYVLPEIQQKKNLKENILIDKHSGFGLQRTRNILNYSETLKYEV